MENHFTVQHQNGFQIKYFSPFFFNLGVKNTKYFSPFFFNLGVKNTYYNISKSFFCK